MSDEPSLKVSMGPAHVESTGTNVILVFVLLSVIASTMFTVWTTNQQTLLFSAEHRRVMQLLLEVRNGMGDLFLASIMSPDTKRQLPMNIQERARQIVEQKAETTVDEKTLSRNP